MRVHSLLAVVATLLGGSLLAQPQTIWVSPTGNNATGNGTAGNPYKTITFAASVAYPGDLIQLTAGTFGDDELIILGSKNLTIAGMGIGTTVVRPHPSLVTVQPTGFLTSPGVANHRIVFAIDGPARVDIRNLTIDGAFRMPSTGRLYGAYFRDGADGSIHDCEIVNTRAAPLDTDPRPAGVVVRGDNAGDPCKVTVRRCCVSEWGKAGIVGYFNTELTVEFTEVAGAGALGASGPDQIGVQVSYEARGVVRNNVVSDANYLPSTASGVGILLYDCGFSVVEGNKVPRCEEAIALFQSTATPVTTSVRDNQCTNSIKRGLRINGHTGVTITDNVLHATTLLTPPAADDTAAGNVWAGNNYSDWNGIGGYAVPGGTYTDLTPRRGCDDFIGPTTFALSGLPVDLVTGDFDGVGFDDFMTLDQAATPALTLGLNAGVFIASLPFGNSLGTATALTTGEFDGNPGLDVAALTKNFFPATTENKVYIFANNGIGGFLQIHVESLPGGMLPTDLAAGAFQGLAVDDLVVSDGNGGGLVLRNAGAGTAWTQTPLPGLYSAGCAAVATGPIDPGGSVDIALVEGNGLFGILHVLRNSGGGLFLLPTSFGVGIDPTSVELSDLNSDGALDILVGCTGAPLPTTPGEVRVLENYWPTLVQFKMPVGLGPVELAVGDIGRDWDPDTPQRPDAAAVNFAGNNITLMTEYGTCTRFASGGITLVGGQPRGAAFAHFDNNFYLDLLVIDTSTNSALIAPGTAKARADLYGRGCPGFQSRTPFISTEGKPAVANQPNPTFGIKLTNSRPLSFAGLVMSASWNGLLGPCQPMIGPSAATFLLVNGLAGDATVSLAIPPGPALLGVSLYFQWGVFDPDGAIYPGVATTAAMKVDIGF